MAEIRIRNWREFQQYKDRFPPWIKLHKEILQSEDWVLWNDRSRVLAIALMLLASRTEEGTVPLNPDYIKRVAYLNNDPDFDPLISCGFIEIVGDASEPYTTQASRTTEAEAEAETEKRRGEISFSDFWGLYPRKTNKKNAEIKWKNLTVKNQKAAMAALPEHIATWDDPKYIPHATTWLNQKRWEDDLDTVTKPKSSLDREILALSTRLQRLPSEIEDFFNKEGRLPTCEEDFDE